MFCAWITPGAVTSVSERSVVLQQQIRSGEDLPGCTINHSKVKISCWLISVSWMRFFYFVLEPKKKKKKKKNNQTNLWWLCL